MILQVNVLAAAAAAAATTAQCLSSKETCPNDSDTLLKIVTLQPSVLSRFGILPFHDLSCIHDARQYLL